MRCQSAHGAVTQLGLAIKQQQQASQERWSASQAPVRLLIRAEISRLHGGGERQRLPEAQVQPIAGNGVDASGRVAN
jgi:ribosomal protein L2